MRVRVGMDATAAMGIVQRRGLSKLRHVEVDVLWVQEQQARRLMPLRKVLGTKNPSDMMTKNVPCTTMELYLNMLQLRFASGRAKIAQQLHSMGEMSNHDALVRASLEAGDPRAGLSRVIVGQEDPRVDASLVVGDPAAGLTNVLAMR